MFWVLTLCILGFVFMCENMFPSVAYADSGEGSKKLIEFGWDEPGTDFMRDHISEMEKTPFDGCVFHVNYRKADGSAGSFTWECWGNRTFREEELKDAVDNLKNTRFQSFTHNFMRFNVTPGDIDWFDDFTPIITNARLAARVARQCGIKGLLFDIEQYNSQLFNYAKQRDSAARSWDEYAEQTRLRGREVMEAFQSEYPGVTIFLTFGYCLPWAQMDGKRSLAEVSYGLLAPFLDGMLDAVNTEPPRPVIVDGCELAYSYKDTSRFAKTYRMMTEDMLKIVNADVEKYRAIFSFGFGVWMDNGWRQNGWDTENFSKNFYTPEEFGATLSAALKTSDEYVWIYTETPRWWTGSGSSEKLPGEYFESVMSTKENNHQD